MRIEGLGEEGRSSFEEEKGRRRRRRIDSSYTVTEKYKVRQMIAVSSLRQR
jgi:hypothetical protein